MFGFNFQETDLVLDASLSSIAPDPVLEIHLDTHEAEAGLWVRNPLYPSPHSCQLLVPAEIAGVEREGSSTERAEATGLLISPRTLFQRAGERVPRTGANEARLRAEAHQLKETVKGLEQTVNSNESAKLIQEIRRLEKENEIFRQQMHFNEEIRINLDKEIAEMKTVNTHLNAKLREESELVQQLRKQLNFDQMESLGKEVDSLRQDNAGLRGKVGRLTDELLSAKEHIKFLEVELLETEGNRIAESRLLEAQRAAAAAQIQETQRTTLHTAALQLSKGVARLFDPVKMAKELAALELKKAQVRL